MSIERPSEMLIRIRDGPTADGASSGSSLDGLAIAVSVCSKAPRRSTMLSSPSDRAVAATDRRRPSWLFV